MHRSPAAAKPGARPGGADRTAPFAAADQHYLGLRRISVNPNLGDDEGMTALRTVVDGWRRAWMPAVKDRVSRIATALLAAGAADRPGPDGKTSLDVAVERDAGRIAEALRAAR